MVNMCFFVINLRLLEKDAKTGLHEGRHQQFLYLVLFFSLYSFLYVLLYYAKLAQ